MKHRFKCRLLSSFTLDSKLHLILTTCKPIQNYLQMNNNMLINKIIMLFVKFKYITRVFNLFFCFFCSEATLYVANFVLSVGKRIKLN